MTASRRAAEHGVGGRDARAEVDPVLLLDAGHEARVAGDVGEQQVPLACRRICPCRRPGSLCSLHVLSLPVLAKAGGLAVEVMLLVGERRSGCDGHPCLWLTTPMRRFRPVLVGLYAWTVTMAFGAVLLDVVWANQLPGNGIRDPGGSR